MPVYEYQCEDCGRKFDVVATLAEKEAGLKPACPKCGRTRARQVFGHFTILGGSKSGADDFGDEDLGGDDVPGMDGGMGDMSGLDDYGADDAGGIDDDLDV